MSSQEIADLVGSRHDNVRTTIQRLAARVHHVPALVVGELQVRPQPGLQHHLGQVELGREEGRRHVIIAVQGQHAQMRVDAHRDIEEIRRIEGGEGGWGLQQG